MLHANSLSCPAFCTASLSTPLGQACSCGARATCSSETQPAHRHASKVSAPGERRWALRACARVCLPSSCKAAGARAYTFSDVVPVPAEFDRTTATTLSSQNDLYSRADSAGPREENYDDDDSNTCDFDDDHYDYDDYQSFYFGFSLITPLPTHLLTSLVYRSTDLLSYFQLATCYLPFTVCRLVPATCYLLLILVRRLLLPLLVLLLLLLRPNITTTAKTTTGRPRRRRRQDGDGDGYQQQP